MSSIPRFDEALAKNPVAKKLLVFHRPGESVEQRVRRFLFVHNEVQVACPHCKEMGRPAFRFHQDWTGLAMCRQDKCGQAFNLSTCVFWHQPSKVIITEDFDFPF